MMREFKSRQYISESGGFRGRKTEKIGVSEKDWQTLEIIAQRVGGDFGMQVRLEKPGEGSFFNHDDCSITFNPLHIKENPEQAKFIAGHEGAHRAITPGPKEMGLSEAQIRELYSQIGFAFLQNAVEDPAVNDWMGGRFPGLKEHIQKFYDEQLKEGSAVFHTPEIARMAFQLGYWPRFAQYGTEIIRYWHQKRLSEKLDPAVESVLKRTIENVMDSIKTIPDSQKIFLPREDNKIAN